MEEASKAFIADQVLHFSALDIGGSSRRLREALIAWRKIDDTVKRVLSGLLKIVTDSCDHAGATTGSNERDGSWMNPCPHCGHSY